MNSPYGYGPQASNPYAAPQAMPGFGPPGYAPGPMAISYRAHGGGLKWAYLGTLLGGFAIAGLGGGVMAAGEDDVGAVLLILGLSTAFALRLVFALMWMYSAWSAIPFDYRVTGSGKRVSPGEAVGFMFIPIFNLYWMFVASGGLCDALDHMLRSSGTSRTSPKGLALAACIMQFIPYVNFLFAPFMWAFYMFSFDSAAKALETAAASGGAGAPVGFGGAGAFAPPAGGFGAPVAGYGPPPGGYGPPPGGYGMR